MSTSSQREAKPAIHWSNIALTPLVIEKLHLLTSNKKTLSKEGYVFEPLTDEDIWKKMRCRNCGTRLRNYRPPVLVSQYGQQADPLTVDDENINEVVNSAQNSEHEYINEVAQTSSSTIQHEDVCFFHGGRQFKGIWQCCGQSANQFAKSKGCCSKPSHTACDVEEAREEWLYHRTPKPVSVVPTSTVNNGATRGGYDTGRGSRGDFRGGRGRYVNTHTKAKTFPRNNTNGNRDIRPVVALDCEMGTTTVGNSALVRLSLVDFFTREPLVDRLVAPSFDMAHYNTKYSGVTFAAMRNATRQGQAILGTDAARKLVSNHVDAETIIIMHGGGSDLSALRMLHPADKIIDTYVLECYDRNVKEQGLKKGLKEVCMRRCGITVQNAKLDNGRAAGHDSLEDAMGCREIVCAWLRGIPDDWKSQRIVLSSYLAATCYDNDTTDETDRKLTNTIELEEMEAMVEEGLKKEEDMEKLLKCLFPDAYQKKAEEQAKKELERAKRIAEREEESAY